MTLGVRNSPITRTRWHKSDTTMVEGRTAHVVFPTFVFRRFVRFSFLILRWPQPLKAKDPILFNAPHHTVISRLNNSFFLVPRYFAFRHFFFFFTLKQVGRLSSVSISVTSTKYRLHNLEISDDRQKTIIILVFLGLNRYRGKIELCILSLRFT